MIKDDIYRWIGVILIGLGIFFDFIAITGAAIMSGDLDAPPSKYWAISGLCTRVLIIPGILLFSFGWKLGKRGTEQEKLAGYQKTYRVMSIADAAKIIGRSESETGNIIVDSVRQGLIRGYIHPKKRDFISEDHVPGNYPGQSATQALSPPFSNVPFSMEPQKDGSKPSSGEELTGRFNCYWINP